MNAADPRALSRLPGVADAPAGGEHRLDLGRRPGCRRREDRRRAVAGVGGKRRANGRLVAIHEVGAPSTMNMEIDKPGREKSTAGVDRDGIARHRHARPDRGDHSLPADDPAPLDKPVGEDDRAPLEHERARDGAGDRRPLAPWTSGRGAAHAGARTLFTTCPACISSNASCHFSSGQTPPMIGLTSSWPLVSSARTRSQIGQLWL